MKRYEAYDSFLDIWVNEIPAHWETHKMKYLFHERSEKGYPDEPLLVASQNMGVVPKKVYGNRTVEAQKDLHLLKLVRVGDFVISLRSFQGGLEYAYYQGIISPAYTVLTPHEPITAGYFRYLAKSKLFIGLLTLCVTGIREGQNIDYEKLRNHSLPVPPRTEQDQIVRYLDWQVSKINRLIAAKRKEIDAIHDMEHLYIDHVFSEIANQKTIRLKYLVEQFVDCPHETPEYCKDGDYCVIRTADQDYGYLRSETLMYRLTESEYTNRIRRAPLNAGDIVYGREGERWGLACVIPESEKFCLGQRIMQFVCNKQMVTPEYVMWALNSSYVRNQGILDTMGSTSPHVNISTIINFRIPYTSREHQHTLVSKIECTMQKYRQLCERIENEIQLLHDLRTRLISDVVTGQVDVRGIEVPEFEYVGEADVAGEQDEESEVG